MAVDDKQSVDCSKVTVKVFYTPHSSCLVHTKTSEWPIGVRYVCRLRIL